MRNVIDIENHMVVEQVPMGPWDEDQFEDRLMSVLTQESTWVEALGPDNDGWAAALPKLVEAEIMEDEAAAGRVILQLVREYGEAVVAAKYGIYREE